MPRFPPCRRRRSAPTAPTWCRPRRSRTAITADEETHAQCIAGLGDEFVHPVVDQLEGWRRQEVEQQLKLLFDRQDVEHQTVDRDQHADGREQRQRGVEAQPAAASATWSVVALAERADNDRGSRQAGAGLAAARAVPGAVPSPRFDSWSVGAVRAIVAAGNVVSACARCGTAIFSFRPEIFGLASGGWGPMSPPRSNARASGPRGYATTSSVLAIALVAGSFDRFVNSRPPPRSGGRPAKGGPVR